MSTDKGLDSTIYCLDTVVLPVDFRLIVGIPSMSPDNYSIKVLISCFQHLQKLLLSNELHIIRTCLPIVVLRPDISDYLLLRVVFLYIINRNLQVFNPLIHIRAITVEAWIEHI